MIFRVTIHFLNHYPTVEQQLVVSSQTSIMISTQVFLCIERFVLLCIERRCVSNEVLLCIERPRVEYSSVIYLFDSAVKLYCNLLVWEVGSSILMQEYIRVSPFCADQRLMLR